MDYTYINSNTELRTYLKTFDGKGQHVIALDIEAQSNLHAYGEKLCLVQIFDGVNNVIIDPFGVEARRLKRFFENNSILKVMYDAGSDLSLLKNSDDTEIKSILDLRPAVELLEYEKQDLHSVLAVELGVQLEKKKKYQKYNWTKRPVADQAIGYALNDVIHLLMLKDIILAKLYAKKMFEQFFLRNMQIQHKDYTRHPDDKYRKISGYSRLPEEKKAVFRRVFDVRERYAKQFDMPSHNVIQKGHLIRIVNDSDVIDGIRFSKRIRSDLIQDIVKDLKEAVNTG